MTTLPSIYRLGHVLLWWLVFAMPAGAVDLSNPQRFLFAADKSEPIIDVVDLTEGKVVYRIETDYVADDIVVPPHASLLYYSNVDSRLLVAYDLAKKEVVATLELNMVPRHVVLDSTGSFIGVTDSQSGGFTLISTYNNQIGFELPSLPATGDVLFDPNEIDIYFSDSAAGAIGIIDINNQQVYQIPIEEGKTLSLSSPSRSLDGRYIYVADRATGDVYGINGYSKVIYKTFNIGSSPARPYTTPEGSFLYLLDTANGRFVSYEQHRFTRYDEQNFGSDTDLVSVGRFDRYNLFASSVNGTYFLYDNLTKTQVESGKFNANPMQVFSAADGKTAYVAFGNSSQIASYELESRQLSYIPVTRNGVGAFTLGLSNTVCH
ncbi:YncE family protein [Kineobactrum salinum]|uniref:YncE family protein n=1 Tax=Kineobactrum salinum TaxID=2708301 RepID=A0A6C0TYY6_9GAMM|nr:YncE family protein [Kineobactrum salinum]QIB64986.1 YncE family protein [Kineobactrum salinum]